MSIRNQIIIAFIIIFLSCIAVSFARAAEKEVAIPPDATSEQIDAIMAGMSDEQVRTLLIQELRKEAVKKKPAPTDHDLAVAFTKELNRIHQRFLYLFEGAAAAKDIPDVMYKAFSGNGKIPLRKIAEGILLLTVVWIAVRLLYRRKTKNLRKIIETTPGDWGFFRKASRLLLRAGLDFLGILLSSLVIFGIYFFYFKHTPAAKNIIMTWFIAMLIMDVVGLLSRLVLVPKAEGLRYLPMENETALTVYHWILWISRLGAVGLFISFLILLQGGEERRYLLSIGCTGLVVVCGLSLLIAWEARTGTKALRAGVREGSLRYQLAGVWHVTLISFLFLGWAVWVFILIVRGSEAIIPAVATLLSVPAYFVANWLAQQLIDYMSGVSGGVTNASLAAFCAGNKPEEPADKPAAQAPEENEGSASPEEGDDTFPLTTAVRFRNILRASFRIAIFAMLLMVLLFLWGVPVRVGLATARSFLGILFTVVMAYIIWALINMAIERKINSHTQDEAGSGDEGGGGGGDRFATLLQLFKKFLFGFMLVVVSLIILSSLGIDITPLLAGASVFGLAIGFGAQALVKDVISGIFFLMDDAFRVNDYIQVGESMGTVEEISIRSLKLRHHRGSLFTIPFGTINFVTNMSRGFAIMKLAYLVPFDTDVQKIKKIMKRINKEIREDPAYDSLLLDDIKSQGVKAIEQYGLRMRVKFKTKPGGQWSIRKLVYAKMRKIFKEEGIEFARPSVAVHVPDGEHLTPEQEQEISAAAQNMAQDDAAAQAKKGTTK